MRVTVRKARVRVSDIFYLSLKQQEEANYKGQIFFPSLYKIKKRFLLKFCVAMMTPAAAAAAAAKSLQSCPTPCDPIDSSPPGSPVPGILQARTLEWVAISISRRSP